MKSKLKNNPTINLQMISKDTMIPSLDLIQQWLSYVLVDDNRSIEVNIRVVDEEEMTNLNETYRKKLGPTNVLAFPFGDNKNYLGDIVICAPIVKKEAKKAGKIFIEHFAHMVIHGALHLLGYDHIKEKDADEMERKEIDILNQCGFENPY